MPKKLEQEKDTIQRFIFEKHGVRGVIVRLSASYEAAWQRHAYSMPVRKLLGEALCTVALLSATVKFSGRFTLQVQGGGPLSLLLAQGNEAFQLRGLALAKDTVPDDFNKAVGKGHLIINIDQGEGTEPYQGVTQITGDRLTHVIEHYFQQSEQLATRLWVFASEHQVAGLLLQEMPESDEKNSNGFWQHVETLAETITEKELLDLPNVEILHRLFSEEDIRLFEAEPVCFRCQCSQERMETVIGSLGESEAKEALKEQGKLTVSCDFCNRAYEFDQVDIARIFAEGAKPEGTDTKQ